MTTTHIIVPDAPTYITIKEAADELLVRSWAVAELIESGQLGAIHFGALTLVSQRDVERHGAIPAPAPQSMLRQRLAASRGGAR